MHRTIVRRPRIDARSLARATRGAALAVWVATIAACGGGAGGGSTPSTPAGVSNDPPPSVPPPTGTPTSVRVGIDVLALVTDSVAAQYADPELRVTHLVDVAN